MPNYRVLSLGLNQSNFLIQLYAGIQNIDAEFSFEIDGYHDFSKGKQAASHKIFKARHAFSEAPFNRLDLGFALLKNLFKSFFWKSLFFEIRTTRSFSAVLKHFMVQASLNCQVNKGIIPKRFNLYHAHFCTAYNMRYVHYLPKNSNIICSFWGSDLYRFTNKRDQFYVSLALRRAKAISIQTPEMGAAMLKRYGIELKSKVHFALFAQTTDIYNEIDRFKTDPGQLEIFKKRLNISKENIVIAIGYNASEAFQHQACMDAIAALPDSLKAKITVVLSLTYQRNEDYLNKLDAIAEAAEGIQVIQIHDFLAHADVAKLRLLTDVQLQLPISDALSGSVTEVLYAGNVVISGSWLPYAIFERKGIRFEKVPDFSALTAKLHDVLTNLESYKSKNQNNAKAIEEHFFPATTSKAWVALYRKLLSN